jgi:hypothetical protein
MIHSVPQNHYGQVGSKLLSSGWLGGTAPWCDTERIRTVCARIPHIWMGRWLSCNLSSTEVDGLLYGVPEALRTVRVRKRAGHHRGAR